MLRRTLSCCALLALWLPVLASAQEPAAPAGDEAPARGSLVEDRAARKLLEAGDARFQADEFPKAVELWQSVIERYPRSKVRFDAHMRLGNYFLQRERAYDRARSHFLAAAGDDNRDDNQRGEATLKIGICFYEARNFGMSFKVMRNVIEQFPTSEHVNLAYYYIGLGHFQLKHYSRAIDALQKVGTALGGGDAQSEKLEAGKRLYVKIEDADLAALEPGQSLKVRCRTTQGDEEEVTCYPVGRNVRIVLGSIVTQLGKPQSGNGRLEVRGDDKVQLTYIDAHTADRSFNRERVREIEVVGNGHVAVTDGAYQEALGGVVLDREFNVQVLDADRDLSDEADVVKVVVAVFREKTPEELDAEMTAAAAEPKPETGEEPAAEPKIDKYAEVDRLEMALREAPVSRQRGALEPPAGSGAQSPAGGTPAPASGGSRPASAADDASVHSGIFRGKVMVVTADVPVAGDDVLQAVPGHVIRVFYQDQRHRGAGPREVRAEVRCVEGNLGAVRVTRAEISDQELLIRTRLRTASALTNIGNRYKEFGLARNANAKYEEALEVCEEISGLAQQLGGRLLEETYVQLWKIYFEMDRLELAAAMAERLQREFPNSAYVDDALLQLADVARKQKDYNRAIGIYQRLVAMEKSQLRGEAQFGVAACFEEMALAAQGTAASQLFDRAFQEYKRVYDQFPESGRVGEAVARMANYYYQQKDYARAIDTFENVLANHPDAQYLDVILFNYGRCLYRMERLADARKQFDQLIAEFPESPLAADAKKISEALAGRLNQQPQTAPRP